MSFHTESLSAVRLLHGLQKHKQLNCFLYLFHYLFIFAETQLPCLSLRLQRSTLRTAYFKCNNQQLTIGV